MARRNLTVITNANVAKLEVAGGRVTGVVFDHGAGDIRGGQRKTVTARREILLSAGAIGSPQILEVSGIGRPEVLRAAGVDVVHELRGVGENLQDHFHARFVYEVSVPASLNNIWHSRWNQLKAGLEYVTQRRGILTIGAGVAGVFAKSHPDLEAPDLQIHFMPLSAVGPGMGLHTFNGVTSSIAQLRPESRGHLHIKSADPREKPAILANYLDSQTDRDVLLRGMHMMRRISSQPAFANMLKSEHAPGPEAVSDDDMMGFARRAGTTIFHPCGTCKMGSDPHAVVDERLRLRGLSGLRVVDASIMPTMTSGNTNAPTIMIAEKAADMIKADAKALPAVA